MCVHLYSGTTRGQTAPCIAITLMGLVGSIQDVEAPQASPLPAPADPQNTPLAGGTGHKGPDDK